jgi:hypothetical protein
MATKKKTKKKSSSKKTAVKSKAKGLATKGTVSKKLIAKRSAAKKNAMKRAAPKRAVAKKKSAASVKTPSAATKKTRNQSDERSSPAFERETQDLRSGEQAGDLQGVSDVEGADSESVDELIEEGNAFEAGVVEGVEQAGERDEREVRTREVPEDDVPGEYLDED